jgi:hypothetical protein
MLLDEEVTSLTHKIGRANYDKSLELHELSFLERQREKLIRLGIRAMLSSDERMELERIFKKANLKNDDRSSR